MDFEDIPQNVIRSAQFLGFDFDGPLAREVSNSETTSFSSWLKSIDSLKEGGVDTFFKDLLPQFQTRKLDMEKTITGKFLVDNLNWRLGARNFFDAWHKLCLVPEANIEMVSLLKDRYSTFLASDQVAPRAAFIMSPETFGLNKVFSHTFFSCDLGYKKIEGEPYWEQVCEKLGVSDRSRILFGDDKPEIVQAARSCGITAFVCTDTKNTADILSKIIILSR